MNGYQRPGYSTASTPDSHVLQVVSAHRPFAAQFLAAEERHLIGVATCDQMRRLREVRADSGNQGTAPSWLRQAVGSALIRLGQHLEGGQNAVAPTGAAS